MDSRKDECLYCFLLRAGDKMIICDKAPWIESIRKNLRMPNADVILYDASEWNAPPMHPVEPSRLKELLYSMEIGSSVINAMKDALEANSVHVTLDQLYENSLVDTSPTHVYEGTKSISSSYALIIFSPSLSKSALKMRRGGDIMHDVSKYTETLISEIPYQFRFTNESLCVSPDNSRVAFIACKGLQEDLMLDGRTVVHDQIADHSLTFSPNSRRFVYMARFDHQWAVVLDGHRTKLYSMVGEKTLVFSPDSHHLAYAARDQRGWFLVVDQKEGRPYNAIGGSPPVFSPDGQRLVFWAEAEGNSFAIVDGHEDANHFDALGCLGFSRDSIHVCYIGKIGDEYFAVVDGKKVNPMSLSQTCNLPPLALG